MRPVRLALVVLLALAGCRAVPAAPGAPVDHTALLLDLAETVRGAERTADGARYRAERGAAMRSALDLAGEAVGDVRAAAAELSLAIAAEDRSEAANLLREVVAAALDGADGAEAELAVLGPLLEADDLMDRAVATWRGRADAALAEQAASLAADLGSSPVLPSACRTLWDNRARWATMVAVRTQLLSRPAPDEADRQAFLADPYGEDRRAADAADRPCWRQHGALPKVLVALRGIIAAYDAAMS